MLHLGSREEAGARIAFDGASHDAFELHGDLGAERANRRQLPGEDRDEDGSCIRTVEGARPGEHLVEDDADGIEVDAQVEVAEARGLLGRHVLGRTHHGADARERVVVDAVARLAAAHAEVEELHERKAALAMHDEDVLRLHVSVDDPERVSGLEAREHLHGELDGLVGVEAAHPARSRSRSVSP